MVLNKLSKQNGSYNGEKEHDGGLERRCRAAVVAVVGLACFEIAAAGIFREVTCIRYSSNGVASTGGD
jgi:hypothetical protein